MLGGIRASSASGQYPRAPMDLLVALLAAEAVSPDLYDQFSKYGIPGLIIVALIAGFLWPKPSVDHIKSQLATTETQRDSLIQAYETQVIPVLAQVQREFIPAIGGMTQAMKDLSVSVGTATTGEIATLRQANGQLTAEVNQLRLALAVVKSGGPSGSTDGGLSPT